MEGAYSLAWDVTANRLEFTLTGSWDEDVMRRWDAAYRAAVRQAPRPHWTVIGDMSAYPAQSEKIQRGHEALMAFSVENGMAKGVLVVPKSVVAMQMKRLAQSSHSDQAIAYAATVDEAKRLTARVPT